MCSDENSYVSLLQQWCESGTPRIANRAPKPSTHELDQPFCTIHSLATPLYIYTVRHPRGKHASMLALYMRLYPYAYYVKAWRLLDGGLRGVAQFRRAAIDCLRLLDKLKTVFAGAEIKTEKYALAAHGKHTPGGAMRFNPEPLWEFRAWTQNYVLAGCLCTSEHPASELYANISADRAGYVNCAPDRPLFTPITSAAEHCDIHTLFQRYSCYRVKEQPENKYRVCVVSHPLAFTTAACSGCEFTTLLVVDLCSELLHSVKRSDLEDALYCMRPSVHRLVVVLANPDGCVLLSYIRKKRHGAQRWRKRYHRERRQSSPPLNLSSTSLPDQHVRLPPTFSVFSHHYGRNSL